MTGAPPATAYLGLGSNLGDRVGHLRRALAELSSRGIRVRRVSSFYSTEPVGMTGEDFVNVAAEVETREDPESLLRLAQSVEDALGRTSRGDLRPRVIDIDLLSYADVVRADSPPILPHPGLPLRRFVLVPLAEIAPDAVVPGIGQTVARLLARCADCSRVEILRG